MGHEETTAILTVLGSGTLLPDHGRASASYHLETTGAQVLLDCGSGTLHGLSRHGIAWREVDLVAVTHFHTDHAGDLAALFAALKFVDRTRPLTVVGPRGLLRFLGHMASAFGDYVLDPGFEVRTVELAEGGDFETEGKDGLTIRCCPTPHTEESVALGVAGLWGALGYTGDTGPSDLVSAFLEGCDVLLAECAICDPPAMDRHLSPAGVAGLARAAGPELLVVTHVYPPQTPDEALAHVRALYPGRVVAARDGLRIRIAAGVVAVDPPQDPL